MFKKPILTAVAVATSLFLSTTVQAFDLYSATDSNTTAATTESSPKKVNPSPQEKHSSNRQEPRKERRTMERKERERRAIERRERERRVGHKNRGPQERQQGPMEHRENHEQQPKNSNPNKLNQEQPSMDHNNPFVPTPASKTAPPPE